MLHIQFKVIKGNMKFGILVFPGSNCDKDCEHVVKNVFGSPVEMIWHKDTSLKGADVIIIPGGFSYGDYLRCGAIAKFSPIMKEVISFAKKGGKVIGICNGFQILIEAGLLPGVLTRNQNLKFICDTVTLTLETTRTPFTRKGQKGAQYRMPIAHGEGNYFIDTEGLKKLHDNDQIVFRYVDNPNGSVADIAGICSVDGHIVGMMPHPERMSEEILGGVDGRIIFESLLT